MIVAATNYNSHGLTISDDGNRAYVAASQGLFILDTSEIQARKRARSSRRSPSSTGRRARSRRSRTRSRSAAGPTWPRSTSSRAPRTTTAPPPTGRRSAPRGSSTSPTRRRRRWSPTSASRSTRSENRAAHRQRPGRAEHRAGLRGPLLQHPAPPGPGDPRLLDDRSAACACSTSATPPTRARWPTTSRRTRRAGPRGTRATTRCPAPRSCPRAARSGTRTATPASTTSSSPAGRSRRRRGRRRVGRLHRRRRLPLGVGDAAGAARAAELHAAARGRREDRGLPGLPGPARDQRAPRRALPRSATWSGRGPDGYYFARFTMAGRTCGGSCCASTDGRFTRVARHYRRGDCELLRSFKLERPVFGGRQRTPLRVAYRLTRAARVTITVTRGKRVVARRTTNSAAGRTYRLALRPSRARRLPRADRGRRRALDAHREAPLGEASDSAGAIAATGPRATPIARPPCARRAGRSRRARTASRTRGWSSTASRRSPRCGPAGEREAALPWPDTHVRLVARRPAA